MYIPFPDTDIYALTDSRLSLGRSVDDVVNAMLQAGVKVLQYREKDRPRREMLEECRRLRRMTREYGCCFIVNDHVDIALLSDADGVHVGQDDIPLADVRRLVGKERIVGVSTSSWAEAETAIAGGADYLGVGPVFSTATKTDASPVGLAYVQEAVAKSSLPLVIIGGINSTTLPEVIKAGGRCLAMVSAITAAEDIGHRIAELRREIHSLTY